MIALSISHYVVRQSLAPAEEARKVERCSQARLRKRARVVGLVILVQVDGTFSNDLAHRRELHQKLVVCPRAQEKSQL